MQRQKPLITRWTGAVLGFAMGAADTLILRAIGTDFELWVGAYFTTSFVALGFLLGLVLEARMGERVAAARLVEQSRRLADAELRVAHADKLASLGQLATAMAHEIRNPLAIIRSTVQNLDETLGPAQAEERRTCRFVLEEIDRLTRVTSSIVRFARPLVPKRLELDADELFAHAAALAERMLSESDLTLSAEPARTNATLEVDPDLICQALLGLVDNARHFSPPGGVIELALTARGGELVFSVEDCGPGVQSSEPARLFEPFFTTRDEGTGLGLAIVKQIAEGHGGRARVAPAAGRGARFEIALPRARAEELAA